MRSYFFLIVFLIIGSSVFAQDINITTEAKTTVAFLSLRQEEKEAAVNKAFSEAEEKDLIEKTVAEIKEQEKGLHPVFSVHPYLRPDVTYNDNILQASSDNRKEDLVTNVAVGARVQVSVESGAEKTLKGIEKIYPAQERVLLPTPTYLGTLTMSGMDIGEDTHLFEFDFGTDMTYYKTNTQYNRKPLMNFNSGFMPDLSIRYLLGRLNHKFKFAGAITPGYMPLSSVVLGGGGEVNYVANHFEIQWEESFRRLGYELGIRENSALYESANKGNNYQDQMLSFKGFLQAFPKTRFFWEGNYGLSKYQNSGSNSNNASYYKIWLGAKGKLSGKTRGTFKIGYAERDYKDKRKNSGLALNADLNYIYSPKTSFSLSGGYEPSEGNYSSQGFDENFRFSLRSSYALNSKLKLRTTLIDFTRDKYEDGLKMNTYSCSITLDYLFRKWLNTGLTLQHSEKDSSLPSTGYINNLVTINASMNF